MSFGISLSGLNASASSLDVVGNNIANSGTTGFKGSRANFSDVYAAGSLNLSANLVGEGVNVQQIQQQFTQGNISQTGNGLDLALNGNGFFVVKDGTGLSYTRNGTFSLDRNGFLVNGAGQQVQAYPALVGGGFNQGALGSLQLTPTQNAPLQTSSGTVGVNLPANTVLPGLPGTTAPAAFNPSNPATYTSTTSTSVFDSLGNQHTGSLYFVPATTSTTVAGPPAVTTYSQVPNTWNAYMTVDGVATTGSPATLVFSQSGALTTVNGSATNKAATFGVAAGGLGNAAGALSMAFDFTNTTQYGSPFGVNTLTQNGYASGQVSGINVDKSGIVSATYTNGQSIQVGQLALSNFPNPAGLAPTGNSNWKQTFSSGAPVSGTAGSSNLGSIQSGALEASNVDLTKELVSMIVAQRSFQANSEMIKTNDQITQTILGIRG
jgi:flagellar hook protein FlgE